jgi:hypothetical protein
VSNLVTPAGGGEAQETAVALAFDPNANSEPVDAVELVAQLTACASVRNLGVGSWLLVNDAIRAKTERHGLKVFSRSTPAA